MTGDDWFDRLLEAAQKPRHAPEYVGYFYGVKCYSTSPLDFDFITADPKIAAQIEAFRFVGFKFNYYATEEDRKAAHVV